MTVLAESLLLGVRAMDATFGRHEQIMSLLQHVRQMNMKHEDNLIVVREASDCFAGITREQAQEWLEFQVWILDLPDSADWESFEAKADKFAGGDMPAFEFYVYARSEELRDLLGMPKEFPWEPTDLNELADDVEAALQGD